MADAVLFEFLHTEMVAELWAPDPDAGSGKKMHPSSTPTHLSPPVCARSEPDKVCDDRIRSQHPVGLLGKKKSLSVLEGLGFRVGQALGERLPRETLAFREELDALKFLCKDLWAAMFQKHMDGLRTNHQGTYVLQDNSFPLLVTMGSGSQYLEEAPKVSSRW
ncbi:trafficking protein particle complex subunit 6A isoform X3 [Onychomys torridus]|uniref:trafficking protein particle complex subunit 6A isoform X3 n=1 Tax=Onychomys torridus TaxID=38674 RepID=UPI00167FCFC0|nr:trafficking protein particle complex subunit 6A isoform X3 [Onychomys torridus]